MYLELYLYLFLCVYLTVCSNLCMPHHFSSSPTFTTTNNIQIMPMQHAPKYEPPRYTCPNSVLSLQQQHQHQQQQLELVPQQQQQQQQRQYALYSQQPPLPQLPPKPALRSYLKPLPKLPADIEESREMSSTDDLSSRPHSPSMSSSDESYSKTTEGEGEGDEDSPRINGGHHLQRNGLGHGHGHGHGHGNGISMGMGVVGYNMPRVNPLQWLYPCDIQVDPTSPVVDMAQLRDFELSSTTESQGQQTTSNTTSNTQHKGDSCNSFDYQKTAGVAVAAAAAQGAATAGSGAVATKSPFERELQRLLNESSRARCLAATTTTTPALANNSEHNTSNCSSRHNVVDLSYSASNSKLSSINGGHNGQGLSLTAEGGSSSNGNLSGGSNSNSGNNNHHKDQQQQQQEQELLALAMQVTGKLPMSNSFMISKHPVGLEAIKEITRHKNPSESSQM